MEKKTLMIESLPGYEPEIGRSLWCLEDVRQTLLSKLAGISQRVLDARSDERQSIGSLLYHIAYIEADWLYEEVLMTGWDPEMRSMFTVSHRTENNELMHVEGQSLDEHFERLRKVREVFLSHFRSINMEDWRKSRILENYDVTPEWVVYHLIEHEAHHRGQIFQLLSKLQSL
ncbi:DinB family protein [Metabacillus sp. RGM 3146]|uniref:DinB family protein n=1 Tax=Metabacillus sp. RGM 3146 TaxID=3401092 RepID=UPI003B9CFB04